MMIKKVAIVVYQGISLFHLSVPLAIFNDAFIQQQKLFDVKVCGQDLGLIACASGLKFEVEHSIEVIDEADVVIFPSWITDIPPNQVLIDKIHQAHQQRKCLVGLCLGAYVLAYAGLLDGKRATSHWRYSDDFSQRFNRVNFDSNPLYIVEDNLITSAGSAAAIDCCLYMLKNFYGVKLANQIARMMVSSPQRTGGQNQYIERPTLVRASDERLAKLTEYLLLNLTDIYTLEQAAHFCSMSVRSFSRHFKTIYGMSFTTWLVNARLNYSLELLESSHLSITQVAQQAGFSSEQNFRKHFKLSFESSPKVWREMFRGAN